MKKHIIIAAIFTTTIALAATLAYRIGFKRGVNHAIADSEHFVLEFDEHDEYDYDLHIYLDEDEYLTTLFIG